MNERTFDSHSIVNIAAYKFVPLTNLATRRASLRELCRQLDVRGTILLSPEGINLFVAGRADAVESLLNHLRADPLLADLDPKISRGDHAPFRRMLVKIKPEIIAFRVPGIDPARRTSVKLSPVELKRWLDEGRNVMLLDVRNNYEVALGTFQNSIPAGVDSFRQFPQAVRRLPPELKEQPIVMFCTGGIRCEKAGPYMESEGFQQVFQLDGGILRYFEDCGGEHFQGECFVFDQRVALRDDLDESTTTQCYACQHALTAADQVSPLYVLGKSCPYCHESPDVAMRKLIDRRHAKITSIVTPLPGSRPYDNFRPMYVARRHDGLTVLDSLDALHPHVGRMYWQDRCRESRIYRDRVPISAEDLVRAGDRIEHLFPNTIEPDVNPQIEILHEDDALVVVNKPAPLPMHPCGRFNRNTLSHILELVYKPLCLRIAHRLDANTSGVVVFSKTRAIASKVQPQFQNGYVRKIYLARIQGCPEWDQTTCRQPIGTETITAGARPPDPNGLAAITDVAILRRFPDDTSLAQVIPRTGRTNQIRIHLACLGFPIVGEATYLRSGVVAEQQTLDLAAEPLCLHSSSIKLLHPLINEWVEFRAPDPAWVS